MTYRLASIEIIDPVILRFACERYLEDRQVKRSAEINGHVKQYLKIYPTQGYLWWKRPTTVDEAKIAIRDSYFPSHGMYNKQEVDMLLATANVAIKLKTFVTITAESVSILKDYL